MCRSVPILPRSQPLRSVRFAATRSASPRFAKDARRVDLGLPAASKPSPGARLALKAEGGVLPLRWIVNGAPIGEPDRRRQAAWTPTARVLRESLSSMQEGRQTACSCASNRRASTGQKTIRFRGPSSSFRRARGSSCRSISCLASLASRSRPRSRRPVASRHIFFPPGSRKRPPPP